MIQYFFNVPEMKWIACMAIVFAFVATWAVMHFFSDRLPKDMGREFAHDGKKSAGKPRGAGLLFVIVFVITVALFSNISKEIIIYLVMVVAAMITGFLDDNANNPWGEYKKGFLDFLISLVVAVTYLSFNSNTITLAVTGTVVTLHPVLFGILIIILVWVSINVTNCTDGVDGLSGTLAIITLASIGIFSFLKTIELNFTLINFIFITVLLAYLWFNATPSKLIMGDAGSRAMGLFIAMAILKTGSPLLFIPFALLMIIDGGLGLVKIFLLRFLKIKILTKVRTPIHDHVRKNINWSNTQTVFRFAILQVMISIIFLFITY